jgi:tetrahydromethanopterin S-methyltransferase subunit H
MLFNTEIKIQVKVVNESNELGLTLDKDASIKETLTALEMANGSLKKMLLEYAEKAGLDDEELIMQYEKLTIKDISNI